MILLNQLLIICGTEPTRTVPSCASNKRAHHVHHYSKLVQEERLELSKC
jgi:hypothetical protein